MSEPTSPVDAQTAMQCFCHVWHLLNNEADKIHEGYSHMGGWDIYESDGQYFMSAGDVDIPMTELAEKLNKLYPNEFNSKKEPQ